MKKYIAICFLFVSNLLVGMDNPSAKPTKPASTQTKIDMDKVKAWFAVHPQYGPQNGDQQSEHQKKMNPIFESMDKQWEKDREDVSKRKNVPSWTEDFIANEENILRHQLRCIEEENKEINKNLKHVVVELESMQEQLKSIAEESHYHPQSRSTFRGGISRSLEAANKTMRANVNSQTLSNKRLEIEKGVESLKKFAEFTRRFHIFASTGL